MPPIILNNLITIILVHKNKKDSFLKKKGANSDMDKMLARKTAMFEKIEINRNNLISTMLKCILKVSQIDCILKISKARKN